MNQNEHLFDLEKILPGLSNYIYHAALTKSKRHFELGKKMLLELADKKEMPKYYLSYILYTRNLEFAYYTKDKTLTEEYLSLASELIEEGSDHLEESQIGYLYMVIVRAAILLENHEIGMDFINQWQQRGVLTYRKVQARLFSIMIHFELNYLELIQSEIILLKRLAKENPREKMVIKAFYSFLNSLSKYPKRRAALIAKFQEELKEISDNNPGYFDFISFDYWEWSLRLE